MCFTFIFGNDCLLYDTETVVMMLKYLSYCMSEYVGTCICVGRKRGVIGKRKREVMGAEEGKRNGSG